LQQKTRPKIKFFLQPGPRSCNPARHIHQIAFAAKTLKFLIIRPAYFDENIPAKYCLAKDRNNLRCFGEKKW